MRGVRPTVNLRPSPPHPRTRTSLGHHFFGHDLDRVCHSVYWYSIQQPLHPSGYTNQSRVIWNLEIEDALLPQARRLFEGSRLSAL